jgi:nucleotide-binding universal stress UspA family protein
MNEWRDGAVVVGVDSSPGARRAAKAAAVEASVAGVGLVVVHVSGWPLLYSSLANIPFEAEQWSPSAEAVELADATVAWLGREHPGLAISTVVRVGRGGEQLARAGEYASLLVVGATGARGVAGVLTGSVAPYVLTHARCPVMVVRVAGPGTTTGGEVCVGVDGTPGSLSALRYAADWAHRRDARVRALFAVDDASALAEAAETRLRDWVAEALGDDEPADTVVVRRSSAAALVEASRAARLMVVGARRHHGLLYGSVSHALVRRSSCPVVVVPEQPVGASLVEASSVDGRAA